MKFRLEEYKGVPDEIDYTDTPSPLGTFKKYRGNIFSGDTITVVQAYPTSLVICLKDQWGNPYDTDSTYQTQTVLQVYAKWGIMNAELWVYYTQYQRVTIAFPNDTWDEV